MEIKIYGNYGNFFPFFFEFFFGLQIQLNWGVNLSENDQREPSPMINF